MHIWQLHIIFIFGHANAHLHSGGFVGGGQAGQKHFGGCGKGVSMTVRRHGGQLHDGGLHFGQ